MSTHYIQFHDTKRNVPKYLVSLTTRRHNFVGTQKRARISHCNEPSVFEFRLYKCTRDTLDWIAVRK